MNDHLRFGVIGTSLMNAFHMKAINSHPQAEVRAICGRDADKARKVAQEQGVPNVHGDFKELIERDDLDAIVVGTPDYLHCEMVVSAAEAGLHVVCEKPLAQSLDQAFEMLQATDSSGCNSMTFFTYCWLPHYRRLKELLSEGFVGRILSAEFRYLTPGVPNKPVYTWHFDPRQGTGILGGFGSHLIYLALWLVGEVEGISAMSTVHFDRLGEAGSEVVQLDDTVFMTLRHNGGAIGSLHVSYSAAPSGQEQLLSIHGDAGTLEASMDPEGLTLRGGKAGEPLTVIAGPDEMWDGVDLSQDSLGRVVEYFTIHPIGIRRFIDDTLSQTSSVPSLRDGVRVQAVMEAARNSSRSGRYEEVAVVPT